MAGLADAPHWPRLLSVEGAARYMSISPNTFRALGIQSRQIGRRVLYDIKDINRYVDMMSDAPTPPEEVSAAGAEQERRFLEKWAKRSAGN
jgi:hypothetical protein